MSIADKLTTIAENEQRVYEAGKFAILNESKYMHPTISGSVISVNDVSPIEHKLGVNVKRKNLFDYNRWVNEINSERNGYSGIDTHLGEECFWHIANLSWKYFKFMQGEFLENTQYTFTLECTYTHPTETSYNMPMFNVIYTDGTSENVSKQTKMGEFIRYSYTTKPNKTIDCISTPNMTSELTLYVKTDIQLEIGSTATDYTPYTTDFSGIEVTRCGKNIFDADTVLPTLTNTNFPGWHWSKQADGSWHLGNAGTLVGCKWFENTSGYIGQMAISITGRVHIPVENSTGLTIVIKYTDDTSDAISMPCSEEFVTKTLVSNPNKIISHIYQSFNAVAGPYIKDIMIAYGTDTEYEPYNPQTATANADGTVEGLTSLSPNMTLYTDNDGVNINCQYYRDIDTYIDNLIMNVALTGGE